MSAARAPTVDVSRPEASVVAGDEVAAMRPVSDRGVKGRLTDVDHRVDRGRTLAEQWPFERIVRERQARE